MGLNLYTDNKIVIEIMVRRKQFVASRRLSDIRVKRQARLTRTTVVTVPTFSPALGNHFPLQPSTFLCTCKSNPSSIRIQGTFNSLSDSQPTS